MWRSAAPRNRRAGIVFFLFASAIQAQAQAPPEARVPPLPPPVSRAAYRSSWFELLSALQEHDSRTATAALAAMTKAARAAGVRRLSSYSRAALHEARKAENAKQPHAELAYEVAATLDQSSFDAAASRTGFLLRRGRIRDAVSQILPALSTVFSIAETRLAFFSSLVLALAITLTLAAVVIILGLFLTHFRRVWHDAREIAARPFGQRAAAPLAVGLVVLPVLLALGPMWLILFWGVIAYAYSERGERWLLAAAFVALGAVPLVVEVVARENLVRRSPLYLAAVDLDERRDDSSVEEQLASIVAASPDQADAWFLIGLYAERAGDYSRALTAYSRAIAADPGEYRALVNRGNVRFIEGNYAQAIGDYEEAAGRQPESAEAFYNLSVARSEIYDFKGQEKARARAVQISRRDVDNWSSRPPLSRVVPAAYRLSDARERSERWVQRSPDPRHSVAPTPVLDLLRSPWCLAPWGALVAALIFRAIRKQRGFAVECSRCGRAFCRFCKRYGGPPSLCGRCVRLTSRKDEVARELRDAGRLESDRRSKVRRLVVRAGSLIAPGIHDLFARRPFAAAALLLPFFFATTLALGGPWKFDLRPLAPSSGDLPTRLVLAASALVLWILANVRAWRQTRES
jgi:tetratricopeptide (TPR) repeat protein